ncbi:MAG: hypothetical protein IPP64_03700 [Bacteroidetes bacterium]|nr:hypothetical protein [Bacteroidota bacterium]
MKHIKAIFLFLLFPLFSVKAQEPKINKNLSFLEGQKTIKLEFTYENLTISGDKEEDFLKENYLNQPGFLTYWENEKSKNIPDWFMLSFNNYFEKLDFTGQLYSDESKYVCVIHLLSIKKGIKNLITPTFWVSYTFYEEGKRDIPLAYFKEHVAYAKGGTIITKTEIKSMATGDWDEAYSGYYKEGKKIAKLVKKGAKVRKKPKK